MTSPFAWELEGAGRGVTPMEKRMTIELINHKLISFWAAYAENQCTEAMGGALGPKAGKHESDSQWERSGEALYPIDFSYLESSDGGIGEWMEG